MPTMLKVRALNTAGIQRFAEFISETREAEETGEKPLPVPDNILTNPEFLEPIDFNKEIDRARRFKDRFEMGEYLVSQFGESFFNLHHDTYGVWAWLALAWFEQLRQRKTQRHEHFIPHDWFKNPQEWFSTFQALGYRHSIRASFEVVARFGQNGRFFISPKGVSFMGDASEQLLSEQRIRSSAKLRELLFELYRDSTGFMKKGALDRVLPSHKAKGSTKGYGALRRLTDDVLPRIKLTYDIDPMPTRLIQKVCGPEFIGSKQKRRTRTGRAVTS
jgi:hypothetical protein